jgi:hypothetical protein
MEESWVPKAFQNRSPWKSTSGFPIRPAAVMNCIKTVTVHSTLRGMRVYGEDSAVPVPLFDGSVDLSQLFAGL